MSLLDNKIPPLGKIQEEENLTNERIAEETRKLNEENSKVKVEKRKYNKKVK